MGKRVITIGREFGSGGRTIGRMVAEKLGIEFYDKDIIRNVVKETGLKEKYVEQYGEYAPSADRFAYSFVGLDENSSPIMLLWEAKQKVIRQFAEEKSCVIVGSAADYILRDRDDCLRVFLYADQETKEKRIAEIYGEVSLKEKNRVHDMDVRRGLNYKYFTGQEWGKAQNYDLALNRGTLGIDKCVELIVEAVK
ncbi:MAG: cytidylate kinase-like family protein [Anaerobutyricum sp.]|nr:cytidylate kinase-like family protein [Eubacterium sp.]MDY6047485.1 cytidylate kinase-like family protein [Anaerobutyricum sp.]